jgi:hypothetical protein
MVFFTGLIISGIEPEEEVEDPEAGRLLGPARLLDPDLDLDLDPGFVVGPELGALVTLCM